MVFFSLLCFLRVHNYLYEFFLTLFSVTKFPCNEDILFFQ